MPGRLSRTGRVLLAILAVFATTLICFRVLHANATAAAVTLLLSVLLTGTYATLPEAIIAAFTATFCLDYFFIPPIRSVTVGDPQGWIVLAVFLIVSLIATNLSSRLRRQRDELLRQQTETEKLHALSRAMLFSEETEGMERLVINKCMELFSLTEIVLFELLDDAFYRSATQSSIPDELLRRVARNGSVHQSKEDRLTAIRVALGNKIFGSLAFRGPMLDEQAMQALGSTIAMGIAQTQARTAGSRAEAIRRSEELKSVMIDALAHDLKTPLTAIEAAGDMLLSPANISSAQRQDLLEVIKQETGGLRRIVEEAIHLARIDAERLKLDCQAHSVDEIIQAAIASLGERAGPHQMEPGRIQIHTAGAPLVSADRELIMQALKQLIDNAIKYSPAKSVISITASAADGMVTIGVRDRGPGLTELEQSRVFDKFYRSHGRSGVQGTGMGLAIVKEILEAHGGSAGVRSERGQGSEFFISLHEAFADASVAHQRI